MDFIWFIQIFIYLFSFLYLFIYITDFNAILIWTMDMEYLKL